MLVLAVDTATPAVTVALTSVDAGGVEVRARSVRVDPRRHGELVAPALAEVLAGHTMGEIAAVVAGVGPGPFTGLRVGLVTAAGLADALGVPAYGVGSLDAIATATGEPLLVATDARRREVYWAAYDAAGVRVAGPYVDRPSELPLGELGVRSMAGAGARQYAEVLGLPLREPDFPDPAVLVGLARDRVLAGAPSEQLTPLYLRRPDAAEPTPPKPVTRT